jgi:hypothetical protein
MLRFKGSAKASSTQLAVTTDSHAEKMALAGGFYEASPVIPDCRKAASPESIFPAPGLWIPGSRAKARAPE